ncbi:hypothetical protein [Staphylococcus epidermidis]|uniref:hypothetical protein n=1 Tax=Staphylococcus epidermidis TaxID=1282 RepID=UPI0011A37CF2|nr:hypothetical protein [Staphylococcus epidermidis]
MKHSTINNHSKPQFIIQTNHHHISIIQPFPNASFKILPQFNALNTHYIQLYHHTLLLSIHHKHITLFHPSSHSI